MNVIRMIKQFGWEKRMFDKIGAKRDEELVWIRWRRIINVLSFTVKCVLEPIFNATAKAISPAILYPPSRCWLHMLPSKSLFSFPRHFLTDLLQRQSPNGIVFHCC
jgi:hypothetical protein